MAQHHELGDFGMFARESLERLIESFQVRIRVGGGQTIEIETYAAAAAALGGIPAPGVIDQDPPHRRGCGPQVISLRREGLNAAEFYKRLVDERRRVERVAWRFAREFRSRQPAQFVVYQRD